jgi:hypothetical protein
MRDARGFVRDAGRNAIWTAGHWSWRRERVRWRRRRLNIVPRRRRLNIVPRRRRLNIVPSIILSNDILQVKYETGKTRLTRKTNLCHPCQTQQKMAALSSD